MGNHFTRINYFLGPQTIKTKIHTLLTSSHRNSPHLRSHTYPLSRCLIYSSRRIPLALHLSQSSQKTRRKKEDSADWRSKNMLSQKNSNCIITWHQNSASLLNRPAELRPFPYRRTRRSRNHNYFFY